MAYRWLVDATVLIHFAVVAFVVAGASLLFWRKWIAWVHLPLTAWVVFAEVFHYACPLTVLEHYFQDQAGGQSYKGDFVDHYIGSILYPNGEHPLPRSIQVGIGCAILVINVVLYFLAFRRRSGNRSEVRSSTATSDMHATTSASLPPQAT